MNTNISIPHSEKVLRLLQCQTSYFSTYLPPSAFKRYQLKLIIHTAFVYIRDLSFVFIRGSDMMNHLNLLNSEALNLLNLIRVHS